MKALALGFGLLVLLAGANLNAQSRDSYDYGRGRNDYPTYDSPGAYRGGDLDRQAPRQLPRNTFDPATAQPPAVSAPAPVARTTPGGYGWQPLYLLSGPAALFKGVGASVWCIGSMSADLFSNVDTPAEGFTATFLWAPAIVADSVLSTAAYALVGAAHTLTFGFLVQDPPRQMEDIPAPIYCLLSGNTLSQ